MRPTACSVPVMLIIAIAAFGQPSPTFEVASVRSSPPIKPGERAFFGPARGGPGTPDPGQVTWTYATLKNLLTTAYNLKNYQVIGPAWLDTELYDINAKVPPDATKEQVRVMWQNLIAERFGVRLRHEPKEFQVQELVVAKGGPKLREVAGDQDPGVQTGPPKIKDGKLENPGFLISVILGPPAKAHVMSKAQPIARLIVMLTNQVGRPVVDKTGLTGVYDYELEFAFNLSAVPPPPGVVPPPAAISSTPIDTMSEPIADISSALQSQLGLRLVSSKAKLDTIVIDKAEKVPTEN
jgi:uncharacterized protein (TIGR03435 family)